MKKIFKHQLSLSVLLSVFVSMAVVVVVAPVSCKLTDEGVEITSTDTSAPEIEAFSVNSGTSITISCSEEVIFDEIKVVVASSSDADTETDSSVREITSTDNESVYAVASLITYNETGDSAEITLSTGTKVGVSYVISGIAYDTSGNSLEFSRSFTGYNDNPARLLLNEIRTKYESKSEIIEYVELYVLKGGNTYGLEIVSAANGEAKKYTLPSIEVMTGEYITVHGRILDSQTETALDELADDLTLSTAKDSCDTGRDLWKAGSDKIVSNTDVVVLRDATSLQLKDAVLLCESKNSEWTKTAMKEYAAEAFSVGIWTSGDAATDAVVTDSATTQYRSISRQNTAVLALQYADASLLPEYIGSSASDWLLTEKYTENKVTISGATPGYENSTNPYVPK